MEILNIIMSIKNSKFTHDSAMKIIDITVESHKEICCKLGIFDKYEDAVHSIENVGGEADGESEMHLLGRYLNSAARAQLAICSVDEELDEINFELLAQLAGGEIYIIDIAAGHGSGVLSIINGICYHRLILKDLPLDLLDVEIHALDISAESLDYYENVLEVVRETYDAAGIKTKLFKHCVNLKNDVELKSYIKNIKDSIGKNPRFLLVCSAISGVSKRVFENEFLQSYEFIAKSFAEKNSLFFWIEPSTKKCWIDGSWQTIAEEFDYEYPSKECRSLHIRFCWIDPHTDTTQNSGAQFFLMELAE